MSKATSKKAGIQAETAYARKEYGVTVNQLEAHVKYANGKIKKARKEGKLIEFTGDIEALCAGDGNR